MVKKIGISIPDSLYEQIQEVKGEIKTSQICQDALAQATKYAILSKSQDMETFKLKLREEKKKHYRKYYDDGFKLGTKRAFSFSYQEVVECLEHIKEDIDLMSSIECWDQELYDWTDTDEFDKKFEDDNAQFEYLYGWHDGVVAVVKEALKY